MNRVQVLRHALIHYIYKCDDQIRVARDDRRAYLSRQRAEAEEMLKLTYEYDKLLPLGDGERVLHGVA